ncbi:MAG: hypothetical protein ACE15C_12840 [Phycisphaerae bacterium]
MRKLALASTVLALVALAVCSAQELAPATRGAAGTSPAATTSAASPAMSAAPATRTAADHAARIAANFWTLAGRHWTDVAGFALTTIGMAVLWCLLMLFCGILSGLVVWLALRHWNFFAAPWSWYKYVRWLWGVIFIVSFAIGMAYSGWRLGICRNVKSYIVERRALDRIAGNLIVAVCLDQADYQATGEETSDKVQRVLEDSEAVGKLAQRDLQDAMADVAGSRGLSGTQRAIIGVLGDQAPEMLKDMTKLDARAVVVLFYSGQNTAQYLKEHPEANAGVMAMSLHFDRIRGKACDAVDSLTGGPIWMGLVLGIGIPLLFMAILRIIVRLAPGGKADGGC